MNRTNVTETIAMNDDIIEFLSKPINHTEGFKECANNETKAWPSLESWNIISQLEKEYNVSKS